MAEIITTTGTTKTITPNNGKDFSLKELQDIVGGYIQIIDLPKEQIMVVNEDGKALCKVNHKATQIAREAMAIFPYDCIMGDVLICNSKQVK